MGVVNRINKGLATSGGEDLVASAFERPPSQAEMSLDSELGKRTTAYVPFAPA